VWRHGDHRLGVTRRTCHWRNSDKRRTTATVGHYRPSAVIPLIQTSGFTARCRSVWHCVISHHSKRPSLREFLAYLGEGFALPHGYWRQSAVVLGRNKRAWKTPVCRTGFGLLPTYVLTSLVLNPSVSQSLSLHSQLSPRQADLSEICHSLLFWLWLVA